MPINNGLPDNFNIAKAANYAELESLSGVDSSINGISTSSFESSKNIEKVDTHSPIFGISQKLDDLAKEKIEAYKAIGVHQSDVSEPIVELKKGLEELNIIKKNLQLHNKVITIFNNNHPENNTCSMHDVVLKQVESTEKLLEHRLLLHYHNLSNTLLGNLVIQIRDGYKVERSFVQEVYPAVMERLEVLPDQLKKETLEDLNIILNRACTENLLRAINTDLKSVMLRPTLEALDRLGVYETLDKHSLQDLHHQVHLKFDQRINSKEIESMSFPDYIEQVDKDLTTSLRTILEKNISDPARLEMINRLINDLNSIVDTAEQYFKNVPLSDQDLEARIDKANVQLIESGSRTERSVLEIDELSDIARLVRTELSKPLPCIEEILSSYTDEEFMEPGTIESICALYSEQETVENLVTEIIETKTSEYLQLGEWTLRNQSYQNFTFEQDESGDDFMLGVGCCWAISLEWIGKLMQDGAQAIDSYETFMPAINEMDTSELDSKPSLKQFREEIRATQEQTRITPRMRRLQAASQLEYFYAKDQHKAAEIAGFRIAHVFDVKAGIEQFLGDIISDAEAGIETPLAESKGVFSMAGYAEDATGHEVVVQIDTKNGIFRFGDSNKGMWTYPNKEEFLENVTAFIRLNYPDLVNFKGVVYQPK